MSHTGQQVWFLSFKFNSNLEFTGMLGTTGTPCKKLTFQHCLESNKVYMLSACIPSLHTAPSCCCPEGPASKHYTSIYNRPCILSMRTTEFPHCTVGHASEAQRQHVIVGQGQCCDHALHMKNQGFCSNEMMRCLCLGLVTAVPYNLQPWFQLSSVDPHHVIMAAKNKPHTRASEQQGLYILPVPCHVCGTRCTCTLTQTQSTNASTPKNMH